MKSGAAGAGFFLAIIWSEKDKNDVFLRRRREIFGPFWEVHTRVLRFLRKFHTKLFQNSY